MEAKKCILVYGLDNEEITNLEKLRFKVLQVTPEMTKMKIKDIIAEKEEKVASETKIEGEKILVFNNIPDIQLRTIVELTKKIIKKKPILATVTVTSNEWEFDYLVEHLMEEREWFKTNRGSAMHEQE